MKNENPPIDLRKLLLRKIALYAGFVIGALAIVCALVLLFLTDPLVNKFIKPRITKAFAEAYPEYSIRIADMNYSFLKNRFGFDSVALNTVDGTFSGNMSAFSVSGIGWMHLLWGGSLAPNDFANSVVDAQDIMLKFPHLHYELHFEQLCVSVPDSEIVVEALKLHPLGDDEQFFAVSEFRETRFRLVVPHARVMGLACLELLQGKIYRTRSIQIHDPFLDALVNKDKPNSEDTLKPLMPNEILSSIKETLHVDSLSIMNGRLKYGERFAIGSNPAWITFDIMQVLVEGIANHGDHDTALVIHAQGNLANAGRINMLMSIPVPSPGFSFLYSGSVSKMDLSVFNSFLEASDQMRVKAGVLQEATFEINVASGCASGSVWSVYRDLKLAAINKNTGSEKGLSNGVTSFIANTFKIRRNNMPGKSGSMKIGIVKYTRQPDDPFVRFTWFALRSGVQDVVGF